MQSDFLGRMAAASARRVEVAKARESEAALRRRALSAAHPPLLSVRPDRFDLMAEYKRRSPSMGALGVGRGAAVSVRDQVTAYTKGGAAAISVLTEPDEFDGALSDLSDTVRATHVPVMRKDFLVDPYQVFEARAAGAAGVLFILRILEDAQVHELLDAAAETGMFVLLEAFDKADLARAKSAALRCQRLRITTLVGLNARNLKTLKTERERFVCLSEHLPRDLPRVAESSLRSAEDARYVAELGYNVALVGTALMRAPDPAGVTRAMIAAGRDAVGTPCASV